MDRGRVMRAQWLICLLFLSAEVLASPSAAPKNRNPDILVEGVGLAKLILEDFGEPVSAPVRLRIVMKCQKDGKTREVGLFRMCSLSERSYEAQLKTLHLKMIMGRVAFDTGEVVCDQVDMQDIDLSNACND